jgi:hypothetical protein
LRLRQSGRGISSNEYISMARRQPEARLVCEPLSNGSYGDNVLECVSKMAVRGRLAPAVLALSKVGVDFGIMEYGQIAAKAGWVAFLDLLPVVSLDDWVSLIPESCGTSDAPLLKWLEGHAPADDPEIVRAACKWPDCERNRALLEVISGRFDRGEPVDRKWRALFECTKIHRDMNSAAEVRAWLALGFDANLKDSLYSPLIVWFTNMGRLEVIGALAAGGALIDARSSDGETALHVAAGKGSAELMGVLVAAGANLDLRDGYDRSALEVARESEHGAAVLWLLAAGADPLTAFANREAAENWLRDHAEKQS